MLSRTLPSTLIYKDIDFRNRWSDEQLTILWAIALWYNGVPITNGDQTYHIGQSPPPKLQTILGCSDSVWKEKYKSVFQKLKRQDVLIDRTILRRKVDWEPNRKTRRILGELFGDDVRSRGTHESFNEAIGLVGDWNEGLPHRTAVEHLRTLQWSRGREVRCYPGQANKTRPDLLWYGLTDNEFDPYQKYGAEVITPHNDKGMLIDKYKKFAEDDSVEYVWTFATREHAARCLNYLHETDETDCVIRNVPFTNPGDHALSVINKYIRQSREKSAYSCKGIYEVTTLTSLHNQIKIYRDPHGEPPWDYPPSDRNRIVVG